MILSLRTLFGRLTVLTAVAVVFVQLAAGQATRLDTSAAQAALVTEFDVNGLKVLVKRRPGSPTVSGGLFIRGGARNINDKNAGIEGLTLTSAIEAGKNFSRQTVRRELSRLGSAISASVSNDYSAVSFGATRQGFDRVWEIFTDVTINPAFAEEDIKRNREQILARLRESEISPEGALSALQDRVIYAGHPYANDVNGTVATVSSISSADIRAFHRNLMETSRLLLVFVGDLDASELKAKIASSFGKLPRGDYKEAPLAALDFSKGTVDVTPRNIPTNYVQGAFNAPSLNNPDYYAMRVAITILQGLIYQEVRVRRQLSYAPEARMENLGANTGVIAVSSTQPNEAVRVMLEQINLLRTRQLNEEVIDEVAGSFLTNYYLGQQTSAAQAGELARYELIGGGWRNAFEFLNRIRQVTSTDVRNASDKYMRNIRFAVVGNQNAVDRAVFVQAE